jgi:hypothetical protein
MLNLYRNWKNTQKNRMLVNIMKYRTFSWENTSPYKTKVSSFILFFCLKFINRWIMTCLLHPNLEFYEWKKIKEYCEMSLRRRETLDNLSTAKNGLNPSTLSAPFTHVREVSTIEWLSWTELLKPVNTNGDKWDSEKKTETNNVGPVPANSKYRSKIALNPIL